MRQQLVVQHRFLAKGFPVSDPLLPDLPDVTKDDRPAEEADAVPDTPNTDPDKRADDQATGEGQAAENRELENPT